MPNLVLGPFSLPNLKKMLPVFHQEAKNVSDEFDKILGDKNTGTVEGRFPSLLRFCYPVLY